jgi:hypothetical protein
MNGIDSGHGVKVYPNRCVLHDKNRTMIPIGLPNFSFLVMTAFFENIHGNA